MRMCFFPKAILTTKEREVEEGITDVVEQGWLVKEGPNETRRKRYFELLINRFLPMRMHNHACSRQRKKW